MHFTRWSGLYKYLVLFDTYCNSISVPTKHCTLRGGVVFTAAVKFDRALKRAFCGDLLATVLPLIFQEHKTISFYFLKTFVSSTEIKLAILFHKNLEHKRGIIFFGDFFFIFFSISFLF